GISNQLKDLGFDVKRFNTGTTPRLDRKSVDYSKFEIQEGIKEPINLSFKSERRIFENQLPSYLGWTNEKTMEVTKKYLSYSPSRAGLMVKTGPRTCPSIEEKVVWFPERVRHSFFLEREGFLTDELYAAGLYMSVPPQKQEEIIHTICGFENAKITRPGYAIAYDFVDPKEINETLETKKIKNLFFAGQINGTTGYDEAAAQGIIAGINASLKVNDKEPFVIKRYEAYIGVMLDDLTHKEINEPYRITPSHVEHRLVLREDNADLRLTEKGRKLGLVDDERYRKYEERLNNIEKGKDIIGKTQIYPNRETLTKLQDLNLPSINKPETLKDLLKRQDITYKDLTVLNDELSYLPDDVLEELEIEVKYEGYIKREENEIKEIKKMESFIFPADFSFSSITSLSKTAIQSLEMYKPKSLGEAIKLQGIKPSDVLTLISVIAKNKELN
ncbi:MAG TPA: FAD-dependent oxidoreductase, partial [Caldisericia bacterium]|nr:FAD-dependent oxidoreductase [Caldisericia bacterium]